ncbi:PAS domain S-box protein [Tumidithrix elongata RA019]|uniref:Circadian input-output histidine kinase CikA n=1 Tax=Tumidithrix elongata BACA0141 TaxID=2716417 RepID=A0AAW9Q313_9CYAN|nr:PAS domain S-box protein [Tumidithrix elongata RA019]
MSDINLVQIDLNLAIDRNPPTIASTASAMDAIASIDDRDNSSGVLVVEADRHLVGIFTATDAIRLCRSGQNLAEISISDAIEPSPITLRESEFTDISIPLSLFQSHHISHLPLVSDRGELRGNISQASLLNAISRPETSSVSSESDRSEFLQIHNFELEQELAAALQSKIEIENALHQNELQKQALLGAIPDLIHRVSSEGIYLEIFSTNCVADLVPDGCDPIGKHLSELLPLDVAQRKLHLIERALATGEVQHFEQQNKIGDRLQYEEVQIVKVNNSEVLSIIRNISDRKMAEETLRQSEARFRNMFETAAIGISFASPEGKFLAVNPYLCKILGYSEAELLSLTFQEITYPDDLEADLTYYQQLLSAEINSFHLEKRYLHKNGQAIWVSLSISLVRDQEGKPLYDIALAQDISERKRLEAERDRIEKALQNQTYWLSTLIDAIPDSIYLKDAQGRWLVCNDPGLRLFQLSGVEYLGKTDAELAKHSQLYHDALIDCGRSDELTWRSGAINYIEERIPQHDGSIKIMDVTKVPLFNPDGSRKGIVIVGRDVTKLKAIEEALRQLNQELEQRVKERTAELIESEARKQEILSALPDLLLRLKRDGTCIDCMMPSTPVKTTFIPIEHHLSEVLTPQALAEQLAVFEQALATGETQIYEHQVQKYNQLEYEEVRVTPCGKDEVLVTVRDISDRKIAEAQVREANERLVLANIELARATRLKDEFLANMSHELRTPLNAILGMSEGLQDAVYGEINQRQNHAIDTIEKSGRHLLELISDILDVSKIEAGKLELELSSVSVKHLCDSSITFVKQLAFKKNIRLNLNIQPDLARIQVDERRMRQMLINLLSNAVKFTPPDGEIRLEVRSETSGEENHEACLIPSAKFPHAIRFSVIDTGIGIAAKDIGKLFKPFVQIDSSLSRQYSGTGLGLTLVKQIANLHGGDVTVRSVVGQGSCFSVCLPYNRNMEQFTSAIPSTDSPQVDLAETHQPSDYLILLAEDNLASVETFSNYLLSRGYKIILAENGLEAIELATSQMPDLILMDIQMPKMDGLEAIRQIRTNSQLAGIPIIALTALAKSSDRERCLAAGANEYLSKPVRLKQLLAIVQSLLVSKKSNP